LKPRTLLDHAVVEEYDPEVMRQIRHDIKALINAASAKQQETSKMRPPPIQIERGDQVLVLKATQSSKMLFPASGPFVVKRVIGRTGVIVQHPITKRIYRISRRLVRPFHVRKGGADERRQAENTADEEEEVINQDENEMQTELEELVPNNENPDPHKRARQEKAQFREVKRLKAHNPRTPLVRFKPEVGHFAIVKQDSDARLGKIAEILGNDNDSIKVQWYGSTTDKEAPRKRWKWHPGYENDNGEIEYKEEQEVQNRPAICEILESDIILTFPKLSIANTLPLEVLDEVVDYTLT